MFGPAQRACAACAVHTRVDAGPKRAPLCRKGRVSRAVAILSALVTSPNRGARADKSKPRSGESEQQASSSLNWTRPCDRFGPRAARNAETLFAAGRSAFGVGPNLGPLGARKDAAASLGERRAAPAPGFGSNHSRPTPAPTVGGRRQPDACADPLDAGGLAANVTSGQILILKHQKHTHNTNNRNDN